MTNLTINSLGMRTVASIAGPEARFWSTATAAISKEYLANGGVGGSLGSETGHPQMIRDHLGMSLAFANGDIYWSPKAGAHALLGSIALKYKQLIAGAPTAEADPLSFLGFPVSDEMSTAEGRFNLFQFGAIAVHDSSSVAYLVYRVASGPFAPASPSAPPPPNIIPVGTVAIDLTPSTALPTIEGTPPIVAIGDLSQSSSVAVGVVMLTGVSGSPPTGNLANPGEGQSNAQVAQGIVTAIVNSVFGTQSGPIGTSISMFGG